MKLYNPLIDDLIARFSYDSVFAPNNEVVKLSDLSELADEAILKRHINAMNDNSQEICTYLGNGAFDVIMF